MVRRKTRLFVWSMAALGLACMSLPASAGLTAYWSYDANFDEEIGFVTSTPRADWGGGTNNLGPGKFSQSVISTVGDSTVGYQSFDIVPLVVDPNVGTFECWVNRTGTGWMHLMGSAVNGLWTAGVQLYISDPVAGDSYLQAHMTLDAVTRDWLEPVSAAAVVPAGQWVHCALVWDNAEVRLYLDGNRIDSQARDVSNFLGNDDYFFVAGVDPGGGRAFIGSIDDVSIWNEVRYVGNTYTIPTGPAGGGGQTCQDILLQGGAMPQDLNKDCEINLLDFAIFQQDWMRCFDPTNNSCDNTWIQVP